MEVRPNSEKPEKKKIFYHEITEARNHEKDHEKFRVFLIVFIVFATKHTNFTTEGLTTHTRRQYVRPTK